ncbi:hypothetical protein HGO34_15640 [Agrobacterium vitis]|uniref:hypothetical protein n=1 Tax=Agrobacterium vitis TaxID=373 RepID=UPI0012E98EB1|nr:hypothetical protein [Agrobacterium vitis]MCM2441154.1 hypothetical protein [Agrobacterium vitis]MVA47250.1 hypothetical protein [Agrobacterium vitis]
MTYSVESRDEARKSFADSGLTYADLSRADLEALRDTLDRSLKAAKTIKGYKMKRAIRRVEWPIGWAALTCQSYYFEGREAVTFNPGGFVGFAGWADDSNAAPILAGFKEWVADTVKRKNEERTAMLEGGAA